jgi:hypothetical protein
LIKADQEKAFDRLSHEYMFNVLEKFGCGDVFAKWIKIRLHVETFLPPCQIKEY